MVRSKRGRDSGRDTRRAVGSWRSSHPSAPQPLGPPPPCAQPATGLATAAARSTPQVDYTLGQICVCNAVYHSAYFFPVRLNFLHCIIFRSDPSLWISNSGRSHPSHPARHRPFWGCDSSTGLYFQNSPTPRIWRVTQFNLRVLLYLVIDSG